MPHTSLLGHHNSGTHNWMRQWGSSNALWLLVLACANGTGSDTLNADLPEQSSSPNTGISSVLGFIDAPMVAFRGQITGLAAAQSDQARVFSAPRTKSLLQRLKRSVLMPMPITVSCKVS
jgi:hypothetical protein